MKVYKKLIIRFVSIVIILVCINFIYVKWFYDKDVQKNSAIVNLVKDVPLDADIIYLGESSNESYREDDIDKRIISEFIADYYPDLNTYDITKPAAHAGIYYVLLQNIPEQSNVKTIVVTLNLRSFNAQWIYSDLETALQKSMLLIKDYNPLFNRFLLSFKAYDIESKTTRTEQIKNKWKKDVFDFPYSFEYKNVIEWDRAMFDTGILNEEGEYDYELTPLACHYIKAYAFQIDTLNNPRIKDFDKIVDLANKRGWNLAFNLLAENTDRANELVGEDLMFLMNQNRQTLIDYYTRKGVVVIDNLYSVRDDQFIDQNWTTEHYAEIGRKEVAKNVADALKIWYGTDYLDEVMGL